MRAHRRRARIGGRAALASEPMSVKAEAKPLTDSLPGGGSVGTTVTVEPLLGGEVRAPRQFFESDGGRLAMLKALGLGVSKSDRWWAPIPAFLIHHPKAGAVLVDTALHPSIATKPAANLGRAVALAKWRMPAGDLPSQLRDRGVDPKSIETVVMTHLHVDHASGIAEFPNATFVLSDREWEAATTVARPLTHGYRRAHYDYLFDYRTIDFGGPLIDSYASFGRTFDLFGDGSVRLAFTPGHTDGHISVIARLRDHDFVIAGDAVWTADQLAGKNRPPRPEDEHQWERSRRELQRFSRGLPRCGGRPRPRPGRLGAARRALRVARLAAGALRLAHALDHRATALAGELSVHPLDLGEDRLGALLLLLDRRRLDRGKLQRLTEADRDLGEDEPLPAADALRAVDRDRDDRHPGLERCTADARPRLAELTAARAAALDVDHHAAATLEDRAAGDERLVVVMSAANREDAAGGEDVVADRVAEQLRLRQKADLAAQVGAGEEVVHVREVVGGEDHRATRRARWRPRSPGSGRAAARPAW